MIQRSVKLTVAGLLVALATANAGEFPGLALQTPEQLAKWRAGLVANAQHVAAAAQEPTLFFTGKPYDKDLGAYLFKFRNYNPELCRWTTQDPSGFPDGANNWIYVNNGSPFLIDPFGTVIVAIGGFRDSTTGIMCNDMDRVFGAGNYKLFNWNQQNDAVNYINSIPTSEKVAIVGHSWGGDTAWDAASETTRRVELLVTLDPVSYLSNVFVSSKPSQCDEWANVYADPSDYNPSDFIADVGCQWGNESAADNNLKSASNHEDVYGLLNSPFPQLNGIPLNTVADYLKQEFARKVE